MPNERNEVDVLIIGMGPAGLSAAIYTSRANLKTIVFGIPEDGHLYKAHTIANYFGFSKDKSGPGIMNEGMAQAERFGTGLVKKEITSIEVNDDQTFTLKDSDKNVYHGKYLIVCTGTSYALSGIKNEEEYIGKGVSFCTTCDGFLFRGKKLAVIGSGNYAAEEALSLTSYARDITILSHGKDFSFSEEMKKAVEKTEIVLKKSEKIKAFIGGSKVEHILFADGTKDESYDGIFMAIGTAGAISFARKLGLEQNGNYIKIDKDGKTNISNLYAAGNCTGAPPQAAVSVGEGCIAALDIIKKARSVKVYVQYN